MNKALFISVKPEFAEKIFNGSKTIELRKSAPKVQQGDLVIIYSTSPVMSIIGTCRVQELIIMKPTRLWDEHAKRLGVDRKRFLDYYSGKELAVGIVLKQKQKLFKPITLKDFRKKFYRFQPPQSFRYLDQRALGDEFLLA